MDLNPNAKKVLVGSVLLVLPNETTLADWSLNDGEALTLSHPFVFGDINGTDRADLIESMETLNEDSELVRQYLQVVDAVANKVVLEDRYFEKTAYNMGCDSRGMTLALQTEGRIGKWLTRATTDKSVVVGDYTLFDDNQVVVNIDSPYEPMLKVCMGQ